VPWLVITNPAFIKSFILTWPEFYDKCLLPSIYTFIPDVIRPMAFERMKHKPVDAAVNQSVGKPGPHSMTRISMMLGGFSYCLTYMHTLSEVIRPMKFESMKRKRVDAAVNQSVGKPGAHSMTSISLLLKVRFSLHLSRSHDSNFLWN